MKVQPNYFTEVYNATYDKVLSYILVKCGKTEDVEDILQETYAELFTVLHKRGEAYINSSEAFVMQLAKSKVYRYYSEKEQQKLYACMENLEAAEEKGLLQQERCCTVQNMEDVLIDKLTTQEVMEYISEKDELTREIFYQHYFEDKTLKEIAKNCKVKESKVKNRLYRTLKELRGAKMLACIVLVILLVVFLAKPAYGFAQNIFTQIKSFFMEEEDSLFDDLVYWEYDEEVMELEAGETVNISALPGKRYQDVMICMLGGEFVETVGILTHDARYRFEAPVSGVYAVIAVNEEGEPENITEQLAHILVFDEEEALNGQPEKLGDLLDDGEETKGD